MAGHQLERTQLFSQKLCSTFRAILMIDSVKSIATDPLREPFVRAGVHRGRRRQTAVKAGVEDRNLGNAANAFLDGPNPVQLGAIVKWCKGGHARDCRFYFRRDGGGLFELLASMNDAMTDHIDFRKRGNDASASARQRS